MGNRRLIGALAAVMAAGLLAGCGVASQTATTASTLTTTNPNIAVPSPCQKAGEAQPGLVDAFRMGAVDFSSANDGVGLTAGEFSCFSPASGGGYQARYQEVPEQLATTSDGGKTWTLSGTALPTSASSNGRYGEFVVGSSPTTSWVVASDGRAFLTTDGGARWAAVPLPVPVLSLQTRGGYLWALSCSRTHANSCQETVSRRRLAAPSSGGWSQPLPRMAVALNPQLALLSGGRAVLSVSAPGVLTGGKLFITSSDGSKWSVAREPRWDRGPCRLDQLTTSGGDIWLLCLGGAAAGSSTKALIFSSDGGRTWQVRSAVADLSKPQSPTGIPEREPSGLAAATGLKVWMGLQNGLATSGDGGRHWSYANNVNPQGANLIFDVVSPTQVFAIAPGAGLWRTIDGTTWAAMGPLNTG